jgi:hypothetical protein
MMQFGKVGDGIGNNKLLGQMGLIKVSVYFTIVNCQEVKYNRHLQSVGYAKAEEWY